MSMRLWQYEVRRAGGAALLAPAFAAGAGGLVIGAAVRSGGGAGTVSDGLRYILEMAVPLAVGVAVTTLVGRDPVVELQLTLPVAYRATLLRRAAATLAGAVAVATAVEAVPWLGRPSALRSARLNGVAAGTGWSPHGLLTDQLVWAAPTLAMAALGLLVAAMLREPAAAGAVVAIVWLFQELMPQRVPGPLYLFASTGRFSGDWTANRASLTVAAVLLVAAAWPVLGRPSWLLSAAAAR